MESTARPVLRRRSLTAMLDIAMHLNRRHFTTIFPWTAIPIATVAGLVALAQVITPALWMRPGQGTDTVALGAGLYMTTVFGSLILYGLVFTLSSAAILAAAVTVVRGEEVVMPRVWRWVLRPGVAGPVVLYWLGVGIGSLCCLIPGIAIWTVYGLLIPVMLVEGLSGSAAFSRSSQLITTSVEPGFGKHPAVRMVGIGLVGYLLSYAFSFAIQMPLGAVQLFLMIRSLPEAGAQGPQPSLAQMWLQIPQNILGGLAAAAVVIYMMLAIALLYTDIRAARDGRDLHDVLDELGAPSAGSANPRMRLG